MKWTALVFLLPIAGALALRLPRRDLLIVTVVSLMLTVGTWLALTATGAA